MAKKYSGGGGSSAGVSNITIPNSGTIGSASDTDAISINSGGTAAFSQNVTIAKDLTIAAGGDLVLTGNSGFFVAPRIKVVGISSNTNLTTDDHAGYYIMVSGSGTIITMPDNQTAGTHFTIIASTSNAVTLRTGSGAGNGDNMNGAQDDLTISGFSGVTAISTGTDYVVLGV